MSGFQALRCALRARTLGAPALAAVAYEWQRARCDAPAEQNELPALVQQAEEERKKEEVIKNPGSFDKLLDEGKRIVPVDTFEGFRLDITKMVTPHFYLLHLFQLGHKAPNDQSDASYAFSTQVITPQGPVLFARVADSGAVEGRFQFGIDGKASVKLAASMTREPGQDMFLADGEYNGDDYTLACKLQGASQVQMSYAQGITPRLAVGAESVYSFAEQGGAFSFGGKYNAKDWSAAAVAMHLGQWVQLQYVRRVSPGRMALVAELTLNPLTLESQTILGADINMKQGRLLTAIDNNGKITTTLESRVVNNVVSLLLSAEMLQIKNVYRFGYGFSLNL